ncbi:hypothetical protein [Streptomyces cyaneofuscatus]|uniref:hypothetical protein n=1 Tax=Streptomyces cyaneofuscatus TaxID=66883 RepID=UPI0038187D8F
MRITLMTPGERAEISTEIAGRNPAAPELVGEALAAARDTARDSVAAGLVAHFTVAIVARLLEVEQQLGTTRATLARVLADMEEGDYYGPDDIMHELDQAGISIRADVAAAGELADAEARTVALG